MSVDLRKKAKKGIDTMGIESVAPSVLGVVNYVSGKKKATMMERARELEKQQKLQNLKVRQRSELVLRKCNEETRVGNEERIESGWKMK